jgi:hypothetical protein
MGESPKGRSHGYLPVTPIHTAHQKVKGEMDGLMDFGWVFFGKYVLNYLESQGDKSL